MMRGRVTTFIGSIMMIMIGVGIIWWFRSVMPSEAFIVSERHRESFSTLNYMELARKTLEEAALVYAQTGASKAGAAGGLDNTVPQKDGVAIWRISPDDATIKDTLKRYITDEMASMQSHPVTGKYITVTYGSTNVELVPDNDDFSKSEKFYVKGDKNIEVSKGLDTQAIKIKTSLKGHIDNEIKLKYFALYAAAKSFLESGEPQKRTNAAFITIDTKGTAEKKPAECDNPATWCDSADHTSQTCPKPVVDYPADKDVLAQSGFSKLVGAAISSTITEEPFKSFNARFEKYDVSPSAGYDPADVTTDDTGTCDFSCNYESTCNSPISNPPTCNNGCSYNSVSNSCEQPVCGDVTDCGPCAYDVSTDACVAPTCGAPIPVAPSCDNGCAYDKPSNACKSPSYSQSCTANTKEKTITFTFLADAYEKYSSEDPNGLVPSTGMHNVPVVAKQFPYDTLKFNFMTHSCTTMKSGYVTVTELTGDASACTPAAVTPA